MKNREGLDRYAVRWNWAEVPSASGFTAVLRVKDEARSLPWVLPGLLRSVERAVLVDNGSTDGTPEVASTIAAGMGLQDNLEVLSYPFSISRCGSEHLQTYPDSVHSLTYYYNWAFSHVRTRYALKWDGDMVLTPEGERVLRDLAWQLQGVDGTVKMRRAPAYIQSERVAYVDVARTPGTGELWGWHNTPDHTFIKCFDWEHIRPWADDLLDVPDWVCFELKWLDEDEFSHWSQMDFGAGPLHRKRREWEVTRALVGGATLPGGVVRIESPEGTHVIEHLRRVYAPLRRQRRAPVDGGPGEAVRASSFGARDNGTTAAPARGAGSPPTQKGVIL